MDSAETFLRIGYYLRFSIGKNKQMVINYNKQEYLDNYYTNSTDFKQVPNVLIFIGNLSIRNWISSQEFGINNISFNNLNPNFREPFFFSHWSLNNGEPVLIQNVKNGEYKRALAVAAVYLRDGINIGFDAGPIKPIEHSTLYWKDRVLIIEGTSPVTLWRYAPNYYAAIIKGKGKGLAVL